MIILLHSSKTMRSGNPSEHSATKPIFLAQAQQLTKYIRTLDTPSLASVMKISPKLAQATKQSFDSWTTATNKQIPAIDCFLGDIYSGFQVASLDKQDRDFAQQHLRIISGLYGLLRPLDGVMPYRLEMAYRLPNDTFRNLYNFWGDSLAKTISDEALICNLSSVEYSSAILPHLSDTQIITPKFMTIDPKTKQPKFVVVHAKIARGAMARWCIKNRIESVADLQKFNDLNYVYDKELSTEHEPVFVAPEFGGLGLSVRLT